MSPFVGIPVTLVFAVLVVFAHGGRVRALRGLGFTFAVFAFGVAALTYPQAFTAWGAFELRRAIVPLVQLILFGMGLTLTIDDFARVLRMPKSILIGVALQFLIMPLGGYLSARAFGLTGEVAAGLILVGSCPGGVASNVVTYLARGNVPLSVSMTACSTLVSPFMTPLAMRMLAGASVPVDCLSMTGSILYMIVLPVVVGLLVYRYAPRMAVRLTRVLPLFAMLSICLIIGITVALSRADLQRIGLALVGASALHNALGYLLGYQSARLCGLAARDCRTVALEVGLQNCGMATGLAFNVLHSAQAAMASATFGPWSAVTSSVLASWWRRGQDRAATTEKSSKREGLVQ